jgi:hypothetical protein
MVAQAATPDRIPSLHRVPALVSLVHAVLMSATLVLLGVAVWLCARRLAGALQQPLGLPALGAVGVLAAALMSAVRCGWRHTRGGPIRRWSPVTLWWYLPTLAACLLAVSVSVPGASLPGVILLWALLLIHEVVWGRAAWRARAARSAGAGPAVAPPVPAAATDDHGPAELARTAAPIQTHLLETGDDQELSLPADVCQQITRSQSPAHGDTVAGVLRASFQSGERSRNLHVAFCPPMAGRPLVEVIQLSGPQTRVKAADVQPFGVRFDLRLATVSAGAEDVLIHFEAQCGSQSVPTTTTS